MQSITHILCAEVISDFGFCYKLKIYSIAMTGNCIPCYQCVIALPKMNAITCVLLFTWCAGDSVILHYERAAVCNMNGKAGINNSIGFNSETGCVDYFNTGIIIHG